MYKPPFSFKRKWDNKKIALVSILIATSVAFVVIFTRIIPIATIPSFKIAIAGLPIKISGYIFGPLIGAITGVISDLLSFAIFPTIFHWSYTLAFAIAGFVPGVFGYIMHQRWKFKGDKNPEDDYKYNNVNFLITIVTILFSIIAITIFVFSPLADFKNSPIKNQWIFFGVVISGSGTMLIAVIVFRFVLKPKMFNALLPIIAFSVILDILNTPLVSWGDQATIVEKNFLVALTFHTLLTPLKSWGNMIIIFFSYKIVSPLIFNKSSNDWSTKDVFVPKNNEKNKKWIMKIYICGPTVYNKAHIGNIRPILTFDIYVRSLKILNKNIYLTHNITDIDDKIIDKALKMNVSEKKIATKYLNHYNYLLKSLNINCIDNMPLVSKNIKKIIKFINNLIEKKVAYESKGNVFFNVSIAKKYGNVSGQHLNKLLNKKKNVAKNLQTDFALWKNTNKGITFISPWGTGRPGWHTECAALINNIYKNQSLDIHGGGIDLIFPHHENEDAQFRSLNNKTITKKWKHIGQININNIKMSKSLGNILDASNFIKLYGADTLRMINLTSNPTNPLNINKEIIENAKINIEKIKKAYIKARLLKINEMKNKKIFILISKWKFAEFNKELNKKIKNFNFNNDFKSGGEIIFIVKTLGFNFFKIKISKSDRKLYVQWEKYRNEKNFKEADKIRNILFKKEQI